MNLKQYWEYLKYILEHKKNVFIECWNEGLYLHAFTHDLSKFLPCEFIPYARKIYGKGWLPKEEYYGDMRNNFPYKYTQMGIDEAFKKAWQHHYKNNKHHPECWTGKDMPMKYIKQMVCDLKAMSRKFGGSAQEYYLQNYYKWDMTKQTRYRLEIELDLIRNYNAPICECDWEFYTTIGELIADSEDYLERNGKIAGGTLENHINDFLKSACDKYNLNIYKLVKDAKSKSEVK